MTDLSSKELIVLKGFLFAGIATLCALLIFGQSPSWKTAILVALLIWSACRFYYFLFYVLGTYVDPRYKYAGLFALLLALLGGRPHRDEDRAGRDLRG